MLGIKCVICTIQDNSSEKSTSQGACHIARHHRRQVKLSFNYLQRLTKIKKNFPKYPLKAK